MGKEKTLLKMAALLLLTTNGEQQQQQQLRGVQPMDDKDRCWKGQRVAAVQIVSMSKISNIYTEQLWKLKEKWAKLSQTIFSGHFIFRVDINFKSTCFY